MKISPWHLQLLIPLTSSLETASSSSLIAAIGERNVSHMEALVEGLVQESIQEPGWKYDQDIRDGLVAIREMFVISIQTVLKEQHRVDQEAHSCQVKDCWGKCKSDYEEGHRKCTGYIEQCHTFKDMHETCRLEVYNLYKDMGQKCSKLHCFDVPEITCVEEKCICADVLSCSRPHEKDCDHGELVCEAKTDECISDPVHGYGAWLQNTIVKYRAAYAEWSRLYSECSAAYKKFLLADVDCDAVQKQFEQCMCERSYWEESLCSVDFAQCNQQCWNMYWETGPAYQCREKDRKIDWSSTKKIECYVDILLHDYTKQELLDKCGTEDCINVAREADYKFCSTVCKEIDYDGAWPEVLKCETPIQISDHHARAKMDQYHLGDSHYACDSNGPEVFTRHRATATDDARGAENRCTEHLDIDYQIPPHVECKPTNGEVCDAEFHCTYYAQYDNIEHIDSISDCCPESNPEHGCFPHVGITSCNGDGGAYASDWKASLTFIKFGEHTHAWGYNRCECTPCGAKPPSYPAPPPGQECGKGIHTFGEETAY